MLFLKSLHLLHVDHTGSCYIIVYPVLQDKLLRGLSKMMDIVTFELASWPKALQNAIGYLRTTAVVVPLIILLW